MSAALTPELGCRDAARSAAFYQEVLGFSLDYARPAQGFYHLSLGAAALMLEELGPESWLAAPAAPPLGRGMHLQIMVEDAGALCAACLGRGISPYRPLEEAWYRTAAGWEGQQQFVVLDPDGYMLRFASDLGTQTRRPERGRIVE